MKIFNEDQLVVEENKKAKVMIDEIQDEKSIAAVGDDLWYDFTPSSSNYNFNAAKYRRLSTQNILEICINGTHDSSATGSLQLGILPQRFRPSSDGYVLGIVNRVKTATGESALQPQYLNIESSGEVYIASPSTDNVRAFIFNGMIDL